MNEWNRSSSTAERMKIALKQSNMKQVELSRLTGIDKGSISNYLYGKYEPKSDAINKMAIALNVSEMWLWGYDVPMDRENTSPEEPKLTEGEKLVLELFRKIPEDRQPEALELLRVALRMQKKP